MILDIIIVVRGLIFKHWCYASVVNWLARIETPSDITDIGGDV